MALIPGTRVGPYAIVSPLGAGGMGEVYRARDATLGRDVALKILPQSFARDADRVARFRREAQVLASLNHPHIAQIYGVEDGALIMELVEGPTLADRIAQGPLPLDEALPIARQIAEALEAAHEQGIIHRDLKPANIKVRPDGTVKVLDFGLAKLNDPNASNASNASNDPNDPNALSLSPTITSPVLVSGAGMILGTAAYMAPEQARGKPVDKRADIWAFGVVLYEMLTGAGLFAGETVTDVLASVVRQDPDLSRVPASVRPLLRRCLEKDPRRRLRDIGDAMPLLDIAAEATVLPAAATRRPVWIASAIAVVAVVAALGVSVRHFTEAPPEQAPSVRFSVSPPLDTVLPAMLIPVLSPDGRRLAFNIQPAGGERTRLAIRLLAADEALELPGTDGATGPFWSPDSRFLGFFADGKLKRIDLAGGPPQVVADVPTARTVAAGGAWNGDGTIVFTATGGTGLFRVPAGGGTPVPATTLDAATKEIGHGFPSFLPDGRHFLYVAQTEALGSSIYVGSLDDAARTLVTATQSRAIYANGYLLYVQQGALLAQPFDAGNRVTTGDPIALVQVVALDNIVGWASFSASASGVLAYRHAPSASPSQLTVVDRTGKTLRTVGAPAEQMAVELSPDDRRLATSVHDPSEGTRDIWVHDLRRDVRARVTFNKDDDVGAVWSPDGTRLAFGSARPLLDLYQQPADGSGAEERLLATGANTYVSSWSADGRVILYHNGFARSPTGNDIWVLPLSGDRTPRPLLQTPVNETSARFSPDGRWVAYQSSESGRSNIYVVPFPGPGGKWQASTTGNDTFPRWGRDGQELFYLTGGDTVMSVEVNGQGAAFEVGATRRLFQARLRTDAYKGFGAGQSYDVFADGQRFLLNVVVSDRASETPIRVVTNWTSSLGR